MPRAKIPTNGKLVVPTWVPDAVKKYAVDNLKYFDEKGKEVLRRLLTHKRMRSVWRELTRHKRYNYRTTDKFFHERDKRTDLIFTSFDKDLVGFLYWSCTAATSPRLLITKDEIVRLSSDIKML